MQAVFCVDEQTEPYKFRFADPNVLLPRNKQNGKIKRFSAANFQMKRKQQKREKNRLHGAKATLLSECFGESSCLWTLNRLQHSSKYRSLHMRSAPE